MTGPGCGSKETEPPIDPASCIPSRAAAGVADECGIFVAPSGSDGAAGTKAAPVATLGKAIAMAAGQSDRIYACDGSFAEAIEVPAGITIYGGLTCADKSWKYSADGRTTVAPAADLVPLKLKKGTATIRIENVIAMAADASQPGGSSIAAIADSVAVELVRSKLAAGAGAAGAVGATPAGEVQPSDPDSIDIAGNAGGGACMGGSTGNLGGAAKENPLCSESKGGAGGTGQEMMGTAGEVGVPTPDPNPGSFGVGGVGATNSGCTAGQTGAVGAEGAPATGGMGVGTISASGVTGATASAGSVGTPGQGGGGGGGSKGKTSCYGPSGGGGGAGGCGGQGGLGGQAGGSSVALISLKATFSFEDVELVTGAGGKGGEGGTGQLGGVGGTGGKGGPAGSGALAGCNGGAGGSGGAGGRGGGGVGGHSIGVAYLGPEPPVTGLAITTGAVGDGGLGEGSQGIGSPGAKADMQSFGE